MNEFIDCFLMWFAGIILGFALGRKWKKKEIERWRNEIIDGLSGEVRVIKNDR